jgi:hypothetical protein
MKNNSPRSKFWLFALVLVLVIAACGGDDDTGSALEGSGDDDSSSSAQDVPVADDNSSNQGVNTDLESVVPGDNVLTMPAVARLQDSGRLIFVQGTLEDGVASEGDGGKLYLADFNGGEPQELAARVYAPSVMLSPNQDQLVYAAAIGRRWYLYVLDLQTLETTQLLQTSNRFSFVTNWSPDGSYITISSFGPGQVLVALDGSASLEIGGGFTIFTQDNLLLSVGIGGGGQFGGGTFTEPVRLVDPATMESEDLDITLVPSAGAPGLIAAMRGAGYELHPNQTASYFAQVPMYSAETDAMLLVNNVTRNGSPEICSTYEMILQSVGEENPEAFAQFPNSLLISDVDQVGDTYYFERWFAPDCNLSLDTLSLELLRQRPGQNTEVILEGLYPGDDININFLRARTGRKYFLSPDGTHVAWISGSLSDQSTAINITRLEDGATAQLLTWKSGNTTSFLSQEAFNSIFWIPPA